MWNLPQSSGSAPKLPLQSWQCQRGHAPAGWLLPCSFCPIPCTAVACAGNFHRLKKLLLVIPVVPLLPDEKESGKRRALDPSRGDCRCLYEPVTEVRLFPDYFKIISPIRFKCKRHQNLLGAERRRRVPAGCAAPAGALCCHLLPRPGTGIPPSAEHLRQSQETIPAGTLSHRYPCLGP